MLLIVGWVGGRGDEIVDLMLNDFYIFRYRFVRGFLGIDSIEFVWIINVSLKFMMGKENFMLG